jgi:transketolase
LNNSLRRRIVEMITKAGEGHIPSAFSIVDIIEVLYGRVLKPEDRFILSKGHGCAALYVVLEREGLLRSEDIEAYGLFEGILGGHPDRTKVPVECSTGSLGHGLPMGVGLALGLRIQGRGGRVFVLVGDGECHEGTTWESLLAGHNYMCGLTVIVDANKSSDQICPHPNIARQFSAFGWQTAEIDGHNPEDIEEALNQRPAWPYAVIARTTKGKGVSFLEGHGKWHHRIPNAEEYAAIMEELR